MNESLSQDASDEPSKTAPDTPEGTDPTSASANPTDGTGADPTALADAPPAFPVVEDPPIAPGVPRLGRPSGTSKSIPETILGPRPSSVFLAVVALLSLVADIGSKLWAEKRLAEYPGYITVIDNHLMFVLAKNKGGAWGLLQGESENVRRPFFLLVSVAAIAFIVTLYRRLQPRQYALKWGLPLVLGGALGNVFDRIRYGYVIDFIDYRADWIRKGNELFAKYFPKHIVTDHWPTFNVADIAICVGVGLMAVDMLTSRRGQAAVPSADVPLEPALEAAPADAQAEADAGTPPEAPSFPLDGTSIEEAASAEAPPSADVASAPSPKA